VGWAGGHAARVSGNRDGGKPPSMAAHDPLAPSACALQFSSTATMADAAEGSAQPAAPPAAAEAVVQQLSALQIGELLKKPEAECVFPAHCAAACGAPLSGGGDGSSLPPLWPTASVPQR